MKYLSRGFAFISSKIFTVFQFCFCLSKTGVTSHLIHPLPPKSAPFESGLCIGVNKFCFSLNLKTTIIAFSLRPKTAIRYLNEVTWRFFQQHLKFIKVADTLSGKNKQLNCLNESLILWRPNARVPFSLYSDIISACLTIMWHNKHMVHNLPHVR